MEILTIETPSLGDRNYLIIDGTSAAAVDPQRDIDRILSVLDERSLSLSVVVETHVRNDYVTGGYELANRTGATYVLPGGDQVEFDRAAADDGDEFTVGEHVLLRAVHTPGHTPHHLSWVLVVDGEPSTVFTGGSLLYGTVGRTDLISDDATEELTRAQYQSAHRLADELPGAVSVLPTHGFGGFCSSASSSGSDHSTIAEERRTNIALTASDEGSFVEKLLAGLTAYPRYYAHMGPRDKEGPGPVDLSAPEPVGPGRTASTHPRWGVGRGSAASQSLRPLPPGRNHQRRDRRQIRHLPGMDHPLGHPGHAGGRHRGGGGRGTTSARPHRHRPARRRRHRGPRRVGRRGRPALLPQRHLRRARRRTSRQHAPRARRPPRRRTGGRVARSRMPATSPSTSSRTASRRFRPVCRCGCTVRRGSGPRSPPRCSTGPGATSWPSMTTGTRWPTPPTWRRRTAADMTAPSRAGRGRTDLASWPTTGDHPGRGGRPGTAR